jgi:hypothetical protein
LLNRAFSSVRNFSLSIHAAPNYTSKVELTLFNNGGKNYNGAQRRPDSVLCARPWHIHAKKVSLTLLHRTKFPLSAFSLRPGRNATGQTVLTEELNGKRLQLLKETSSTINRVGVSSNLGNPTQPLEWKGIQGATVTQGLKFNR